MHRYARTFVVAAVVLTLTAGAVGCAGSDDSGTDSSGTDGSAATSDAELTISNSTALQTFDPVASPAGRSLQYLWLVYDALVRVAPDGSLEPGLATDWEYNEDNTVFDLTLRDGVTFTDETPFDADAVKANLDRAREANGPQTSQLALVDEVQVVSPTEVRLHLSAPNPSLPVILSQNMGMMVSPKALDDPDLGTNPVGAGAYTLDTDATAPDDHYVFVRNPDYYSPESYPFAGVTIRVIEDPTAALDALRAGTIDAGVGISEVAQPAEDAGFEVLTRPTDSAGIMLIDRAGEVVPPLGDVGVRQALNYAVDRATLVEEVVRGYGTPTSQFISPGQEGYDEDLDDYYSYDVDEAKRLLADAGYEDGFTLPVLTPPTATTVVEAIGGFLEDVGVEVEITPISPSGMAADLFEGTHAAVYLPWGMTDTYLDSQLLLSADGAYNVFGVEDEEMMSLVEQGAAQEPEAREATYQDLSARIVEEAWFLSLFVADGVYMVGPNVENATMTPNVIVPDIRGWQPAE